MFAITRMPAQIFFLQYKKPRNEQFHLISCIKYFCMQRCLAAWTWRILEGSKVTDRRILWNIRLNITGRLFQLNRMANTFGPSARSPWPLNRQACNAVGKVTPQQLESSAISQQVAAGDLGCYSLFLTQVEPTTLAESPWRSLTAPSTLWILATKQKQDSNFCVFID